MKNYIVYKISFSSSDKVYIGKTYSLRRRLEQHRYDSKNRSNFKSRWFYKHRDEKPIVEVLYESNDEEEALTKEFEIIQEYFNTGAKLVNTMLLKKVGYTQVRRELSEAALEKMANKFGKDYFLISKQGEITEVKSLSRWAKNNNLNYKDLNAVARKKFNSSQGYIVYYKEEWDNYSGQEKKDIIEEFKIYDPYRTPKFKQNAEREKHKWIIVFPDAKVSIIHGLQTFCRLNGLNPGNMYNTVTNDKKKCKGIKVFRLKDKVKANKYLETIISALEEKSSSNNLLNSGKVQNG